MFFQSLVEICPFITSCFWGPAHWSYCKDHNNPSDSLSTFQALFKFWVGKKICDDPTASKLHTISFLCFNFKWIENTCETNTSFIVKVALKVVGMKEKKVIVSFGNWNLIWHFRPEPFIQIYTAKFWLLHESSKFGTRMEHKPTNC